MGRTKLRSNAGSSPNLKPMEARLPMPNIASSVGVAANRSAG